MGSWCVHIVVYRCTNIEVHRHEQNAFAAHGANYFMKGTLLDKKPSLDMTQAMFDKVMSLGTPHVMDVAICFEYVSHKKVNSIPVDETPYRRNLPGNGIILVKWDDDAPEKYKYARDAAHALANMTPAGEAYGNYAGECFPPRSKITVADLHPV